MSYSEALEKPLAARWFSENWDASAADVDDEDMLSGV